MNCVLFRDVLKYVTAVINMFVYLAAPSSFRTFCDIPLNMSDQ